MIIHTASGAEHGLCPANGSATPSTAPNFGIADPDGSFRLNYNKSSFSFAHGLTGNPLFELQHLVDYARRLPPDPKFGLWSNGKVGVDDGWDASAGPRYSLHDTIANIAENNSFAMLKRVELDAAFGPTMRQLMERLADLVGPSLREDIVLGRGTLLIASPDRITSYHIDSDTNFLFQITGDKLFSVYDQTDRTLLSDPELERYCAGDVNAAQFKESRQNDARTYELKAGLAVHVPSMAPHWAQVRDNVSIALSINFDLRSVGRLARVYKFNHRLRRLGLNPVPPGASAWRDQIKLASLDGLKTARRFLKR